ncbi:MAG: murein biosynthesis integral membrane protein MurJ [Armatimonadota bacterium]|nr:murein biosynthesis integral membrane protein MurJ [Armatimonadota bacterium]
MASITVTPPPDPPALSKHGDGGGGGRKLSGVARAAGIVTAATLLSRLLGMVRDIVIGHQLGVGIESDAYTAAFKIPDLLMYLVAGGALSSTFIPIFKEYLHAGREKQAWRTFSIVATVTIVLSAVFVLIAEIWTPLFVHLLNPGYDQARIDMTVPLTRIVLPAQIFFMLGGLLGGTLNARGSFLIPALGASVYNLGIIFGAAVLYPLYPPHQGLPGLMWGALLGAFVGNFAMQIVSVSRLGMRYRPSLAVLHPGAVKVWKMMGPILLGVSLPNVDQIINGYFASELSLGAQAAMTFAVRLMLIPIGVIAQAMGIALLPTISSHAALGQRKEFRGAVNRALRSVLFMTVPASALLFLLAAPLVTFLLQSGKFDAHGTMITASALRFYSLGIFAWSAQAILTRGFYALQDTRTPVISGTIMTVLFIGMNWLVVNATHMGVGGLALATTIAAVLHMLVMYVLLRRRMSGLNGGALLASVTKTLLATAALCALVWLLRVGLDAELPGTLTPKIHSAAVLAVAGGLGLVAFLLVARLLRMSELQSVVDMVRRKRNKG